MNALANNEVADFVNEHFLATYMKVGTFQIVNGQKQGGNVASYFCLGDGSVIHGIAGPIAAREFLTEARWAVETRKVSLLRSTKLASATLNMDRYKDLIGEAHEERFANLHNPWANGFERRGRSALPDAMPLGVSDQGKVHWMLAKTPLRNIDEVYPIVWEQVLNERLSALPVVQNR